MMNARVEGAGRSSVAVDGLIAQQTCSNILAAVYTRDQTWTGCQRNAKSTRTRYHNNNNQRLK
eukprot:scaffold99386_cov75-Phaeocystis_antarctica.AAC.1